MSLSSERKILRIHVTCVAKVVITFNVITWQPLINSFDNLKFMQTNLNIQDIVQIRCDVDQKLGSMDPK